MIRARRGAWWALVWLVGCNHGTELKKLDVGALDTRKTTTVKVPRAGVLEVWQDFEAAIDTGWKVSVKRGVERKKKKRKKSSFSLSMKNTADMFRWKLKFSQDGKSIGKLSCSPVRGKNGTCRGGTSIGSGRYKYRNCNLPKCTIAIPKAGDVKVEAKLVRKEESAYEVKTARVRFVLAPE